MIGLFFAALIYPQIAFSGLFCCHGMALACALCSFHGIALLACLVDLDIGATNRSWICAEGLFSLLLPSLCSILLCLIAVYEVRSSEQLLDLTHANLLQGRAYQSPIMTTTIKVRYTSRVTGHRVNTFTYLSGQVTMQAFHPLAP